MLKNTDNTIHTSLGVDILNLGDSVWKIDLSHLQLFKGLSVIARLLGDDILESLRINNADIFVQKRVIEEITPELSKLGIDNITIFTRQSVIRCLDQNFESFQNYLRTVLGTLQRPKWGQLLFPEAFEDTEHAPGYKYDQDIKALLFPFYQINELDHNFYFLVERDLNSKLLRITIENQNDNRLNLNNVSHDIVDDLKQRSYLQGLTRISETVYQGILQECENNSFEYTDNIRRHPHFFTQMERIGLADCKTLTIRWPTEKTDQILKIPRDQFITQLKRVFITLEDQEITLLLNRQVILKIVQNDFRVFLDISRRGMCLNVSLYERRQTSNLEYYLNRMPELQKLSLKSNHIFKNTRIFLIHHITGEILATIKALENMGVDFLHVLFVKYAGVVPADYLEVLSTQDASRFHFTGLQRVDLSDNLDGYHLLSKQYSDTRNFVILKNHLVQARLAYFEAMKFCAAHLFLHESIQAYLNGQKLLLIEDGGYLAPDLNQMCFDKKTLQEVLEHYKIDLANYDSKKIAPFLNQEIGKWIAALMPFSVEHTRNGFNKLEEIENKHKKLYFPAGTIAISDIKRNRESQEVSISILHAIESIMHGLGFVLSERKALVLGSRGAIGSNLMLDLSYRLGPQKVLGVDVLSQNFDGLQNFECNDFSSLTDEQLQEVDLVIGVIGSSILGKNELDRLILNNKNKKIYFASGSTKTAEFTGLMEYIRDLQALDEPKIADLGVSLDFSSIRDPQTRSVTGSKVHIYFNDSIPANHVLAHKRGTSVELLLLGGLTPINFLFYGVPTETMDSILTQLVELSSGMYSNFMNGHQYRHGLLAVDREVNADGSPRENLIC